MLCASGHVLLDFRATIEKICDGCDGKISDRSWCCFTCDYDLCQACYEKQNQEAAEKQIATKLAEREELQALSKDELIDLVQALREEQALSKSREVVPAPKLRRTTSREEDQEWRKIAGRWKSPHRTIEIFGDVDGPRVTFLENVFRPPGSMMVSEVVFHISDSSYITFKVKFPPDETSASGEAVWKFFSSGLAEILGDGSVTNDTFTRPPPVRETRRKFAGGGMARMTEPSSKALGLFDGLPPFKVIDDFGQPWCLPVLRTEAAMRLDDEYLAKTAGYFDEGQVPPIDICEEVEKRALEMHQIEASPSWIEAYRFAARMLPQEHRQEIFFLRANDQMFRPKVELTGKQLEGKVFTSAGQLASLQEALVHDRTLLIASTSS